MKTVVGLFDSFEDARGVVDALSSSGFSRSAIQIENLAKGEHAFGDFDTSDRDSALNGGLLNLGVPRDDVHAYLEGVRRGGTLVICSTDDKNAMKAYDIMSRHGSVDLSQRRETWMKSGWSGFGDTSKTSGSTLGSSANLGTTGTGLSGTSNLTSERNLSTSKNLGTEKVIPVIEEEIKIGKREVEKGGVRVETHVTERPVNEQVHLREERVHVERHPVDRPVSGTDVNAFRDQTIEMRSKAEEAVVSKRSRVIEEVVIGKEITGHTENIRDTVKRTDVDVRQLGTETNLNTKTSGLTGGTTSGLTSGGRRFEEFDSDFRQHYTGLGLKDHSYEDYMPVYRYGYSLGTNQDYNHGDWSRIEPDARRHWESRNPGTWEQFKDSIRFSWDKVRGHR